MQLNVKEIERDLLTYVGDDWLNKDEIRSLRLGIEHLGNDQISFLRNRLFELAREQLISASSNPLTVMRWLERCVKLFDVELIERQSHNIAYFSPGTACRDKIISLLDSARSFIYICIFTLSDNRIAQSVIAARERGVAVRIITDNDKVFDKGSDIRLLQQTGIEIRMDKTPNHMHHKFCVVDGVYLINGSFNWTRSASERNQENIVVSEDRQLVQQFTEQFKSLWMMYR